MKGFLKKCVAVLSAAACLLVGSEISEIQAILLGGSIQAEADNTTYTYTGTDGLELEYDFLYDGTIEITKYVNSTDTDIIIPSNIDGAAVTWIGSQAFSYCKSLTSIFIPDSVTSIGDGAFFDCSSLASIYVSYGNSTYTSVGGVLFNKDQTELICYPTRKEGSFYSIPSSVTSIGSQAFSCCKSLTSIIIPDSVTNIGWHAFSYCTSLKSITIPDSVTSIGDGAFWVCESLTSITIPNSVTSIGRDAFYECTSLTSITIPDGVTSIGGCFLNCKSLASITIPDSVTSIGSDAFRCCKSLTSITIPNSVTSIGSEAFKSCKSLTDIYFTGTEAEWNAIEGISDAEIPSSTVIHFSDGTSAIVTTMTTTYTTCPETTTSTTAKTTTTEKITTSPETTTITTTTETKTTCLTTTTATTTTTKPTITSTTTEHITTTTRPMTTVPTTTSTTTFFTTTTEPPTFSTSISLANLNLNVGDTLHLNLFGDPEDTVQVSFTYTDADGNENTLRIGGKTGVVLDENGKKTVNFTAPIALDTLTVEFTYGKTLPAYNYSIEATTTTTTTTAKSTTTYGDINLDGSINLLDAIVINRYLANIATLSDLQLENADCYLDHTVNDKDATALMQYITFIVTTLPVTE